MSVRFKKQCCLKCQVEIDAATCVTAAAKPADGDLNICVYCGHLMAFTADTTLRELTPEERKLCDGNKMVQAALKAQRETMMVHPDRRTLQ